MRALNTRHGLAIAAAALAGSFVLTSCSSGDEATESATPVPSLFSESATPSESGLAATVPTGAAATACAAYFDLDLLNSSYAGGAVADGDMTEEQVKADFQADLKEMVAQAKLAVEDGTADRKMLINAKRMKKIVNSLGKDESLSDLSKAKQTRFAKSSLRVQKACARAGLDLPADNVTARTAAGI
jgi:hypothetical protein